VLAVPKLINEQQQHSCDEQLMMKSQHCFIYFIVHSELLRLKLELEPVQHS